MLVRTCALTRPYAPRSEPNTGRPRECLPGYGSSNRHANGGVLHDALATSKSADVTRIDLPPDANGLLSVADRCLRGMDYVYVIVADEQPHLQYLDVDAANAHCTKGIGI